jgi:hypothetical protein
MRWIPHSLRVTWQPDGITTMILIKNTDGGTTMRPASLTLQKDGWLRGKAQQLKPITEYIPFVRRNYEVNQHG